MISLPSGVATIDGNLTKTIEVKELTILSFLCQISSKCYHVSVITPSVLSWTLKLKSDLEIVITHNYPQDHNFKNKGKFIWRISTINNHAQCAHNDTFILPAGHTEPHFHYIQYKSPVGRLIVQVLWQYLLLPIGKHAFTPESSEVMCVKSLAQGLNSEPRKTSFHSLSPIQSLSTLTEAWASLIVETC